MTLFEFFRLITIQSNYLDEGYRTKNLVLRHKSTFIMKLKTCIVNLLLALVLQLRSWPSASVSYDIHASTLDSGGGRSSSASYTNDASVCGLAGVSTVVDPAVIAKHGYLGQLYETTRLQISAEPAELPEGKETQLAALAVVDDDTLVVLDATEIDWNVVGGPLLSISGEGVATAGIVPQDTAATVEGSFGDLTETFDLLVLDTLPDNFGLYADDGLPDDWQVGYFGEDNPLAAPGVDVTGNGQTNFFSWIADLDPTDHGEVFSVRIEPDLEDDRMQIIFSPRKEGRNYQVLEDGGLGPLGWIPLNSPLVADAANERTVTDTAGIANRKFYRVEITVPE